jgi:hypothetical protein
VSFEQHSERRADWQNIFRESSTSQFRLHHVQR